MLDKDLVVIRGGGDIASGIACRLFNAGFKVLILEVSKPSVIRRKVSFAQAVYDGAVFVEGICGRKVKNINEALMVIKKNVIPVIVDENLNSFKDNKLYILVDAILAKKNLGTTIDMANVVIGVGPGFIAGEDVDAVVETRRGHDLGRVILNGSAEVDTGIPGNICGYGIERVIKSPKVGEVKIIKDIGSIVESGETVALVDNVEVKAKISGVVRGMIQEKYYVSENMKMADVDPRANVDNCFSVSDKARAVGGGVLEGILYFMNKRNSNSISLGKKQCIF
ncbi:EF2563 family selenium-dependent molybdenum hydroxylase system protein [Clostridium sp. P21]|uniref:EF2563 family selenium-dependent molybdenum hydroxylase system protein n=1 Tax=Clostridium muellerianum TaxID=2716538 RepID=A0A7Y0EE86_9CLOT|nr:selenium-dependent molybdenum cofactor biosynthesis protein YqeB [Clostridium muellerianum]NMM61909.1 EF2563 family selenium-dependent molybdenum hydroxylase system protein [Clostridium muellerianum]